MATDLNRLKEVVGFLLAQEFAKAAPKITGNLARTFAATVKVEGDVIKFILPGYAASVIRGSAPHIITPKNKKALKFKGRSGDVFAKKVRHPGNAPNFFIQDTLNRKFGQILKQAFKIVNK